MEGKLNAVGEKVTKFVRAKPDILWIIPAIAAVRASGKAFGEAKKHNGIETGVDTLMAVFYMIRAVKGMKMAKQLRELKSIHEELEGEMYDEVMAAIEMYREARLK